MASSDSRRSTRCLSDEHLTTLPALALVKFELRSHTWRKRRARDDSRNMTLYGSASATYTPNGSRTMSTTRQQPIVQTLYAARGLSPDGSVNAAIATPVKAATTLSATNALDTDFKVATHIASASRTAVVAMMDTSNTI